MEVRNKDGSIDLYDAEFIAEIGKKNFLSGIANLLNEKMNDDNVEVISIHRSPGSIEAPQGKIIRLNNKPGEIIEQSDRKYLVQEDGSWKRITKSLNHQMKNGILPIQIKKIHIAIKDLNISDTQYREVLSGFNNAKGEPCKSCKELTEKQANVLLDLFKKKLGWQEKRSGKKLKYEEYNGRDSKFATPAQMRKIEAEWMRYSREKTIASMNNFISRITGVDDIKWVLKEHVKKLLKAIESLKQENK